MAEAEANSVQFFQRRRCGFQMRTRGTSSSTSDSTERVLNRSAAAINVSRRCRWYFGRFATTLDLRLFQQNRPQGDMPKSQLLGPDYAMPGIGAIVWRLRALCLSHANRA